MFKKEAADKGDFLVFMAAVHFDANHRAIRSHCFQDPP